FALAAVVSGLYFWRENLEHRRSAVLAARERALKAEAASLASNAFSSAQAKVDEGDRLAAARNPAAAAQAYREAAVRYGQAERQAQIKREDRGQADTARARMVAAKRRARPNAVDFAAALAHERRGNSMYGRRAFKEAATSFQFAAELFAKTPPDARADIRALLNDYVRAVETKDLDLLRRRGRDRKSTRLNSSHVSISYAVFCLKKKTSLSRRMAVCSKEPRTPRG